MEGLGAGGAQCAKNTLCRLTVVTARTRLHGREVRRLQSVVRLLKRRMAVG